MALLLMLFHFFAPLSLTDVTTPVTDSNETVYQVQLNSIATPVLLKEKDEKNFDASTSDNTQVPLLDLFLHELNLQARHAIKIFYFHTEVLYSGHPRLITFLRTFLI
jgi:hypothetical protein